MKLQIATFLTFMSAVTSRTLSPKYKNLATSKFSKKLDPIKVKNWIIDIRKETDNHSDQKPSFDMLYSSLGTSSTAAMASSKFDRPPAHMMKNAYNLLPKFNNSRKIPIFDLKIDAFPNVFNDKLNAESGTDSRPETNDITELKTEIQDLKQELSDLQTKYQTQNKLMQRLATATNNVQKDNQVIADTVNKLSKVVIRNVQLAAKAEKSSRYVST